MHRELGGATPLQRFTTAASVLRPCPGSEPLRRAFGIEVTRRQRLSDGTVSLAGRRFEVPQAYGHLRELHLRYARWDLTQADLVDARSGAILQTIHPLDKSRYADGHRRRRIAPAAAAPAAAAAGAAAAAPPSPSESAPAPLLRELLARFAATGLPMAMIHHEEPDAREPQ